jgi:hypothetical protein
MRGATITLTDEIDSAVNAYLQAQEASLSLTALIQSALREYLAARGYLPPSRRLRITPASKGGGRRNVSVQHDRYLAGK